VTEIREGYGQMVADVPRSADDEDVHEVEDDRAGQVLGNRT
jgi:hypothetical protein